jgi:predicted nuclease of predicted toxin-antitoxin system
MKVLLDENIDVRFRHSFIDTSHKAHTVRDMNWQGVKNGKLLALASEHDFDVFICVDKNLPYQQNLSTLALPVVVIDVHKNVLPSLKKAFQALLDLLAQKLERKVYMIRQITD